MGLGLVPFRDRFYVEHIDLAEGLEIWRSKQTFAIGTGGETAAAATGTAEDEEAKPAEEEPAETAPADGRAVEAEGEGGGSTVWIVAVALAAALLAGGVAGALLLRRRRASAPPPSPTAAADPMAHLERLAGLHAKGVLTDEEFEAKKAGLLRRL